MIGKNSKITSWKNNKTRQDKTRQDKTRQDKTRQDKTRQDKTRQQLKCLLFNKNEILKIQTVIS